jgi:hypothetical protein
MDLFLAEQMSEANTPEWTSFARLRVPSPLWWIISVVVNIYATKPISAWKRDCVR